MQKVRLVTHRVFQPSPTEPLDFEVAIENTIADIAKRFKVRKVLFDPWQMQSTAQRLARQGIRVEEFPQSSANLTAASQNLYELVIGRNLLVYPDPAMRLAVSRAVAIESGRGWRITKEKQSHKIDVVVALAMAARAAVEMGERRSGIMAISVAMPGDAPTSGGGMVVGGHYLPWHQVNSEPRAVPPNRDRSQVPADLSLSGATKKAGTNLGSIAIHDDRSKQQHAT